MTDVCADLYLDLMKRSLTGALAEESDYILGVSTRGQRGWKSRIANTLGALATGLNVELVRKRPYDARAREIGADRPARAESMIGLRRMDNIRDCVEIALKEQVPGDLIETGVWRGGATIYMRAILKAHGDVERAVWVADSFAGLPKPDGRQYPADAGDLHHRYTELTVGLDAVKRNFQRYALLDDQVRFLVGWFKDTLPEAPIDRLAILRLDGDMYESTYQAVEALYPKLSVGGFCIVDDYGAVPGCKRAIDDYRSAERIGDEIVDIDGIGIYWRRTELR